MKKLLSIPLLLFLFCISTPAQSFEKLCPSGSTALPGGQTFDSVTSKYRQWLCVDVFGNVYSSPDFLLASQNGATIRASDPQYGVKGAAKWVCDATFTSGSPTVTTPASDRPFLSTDSFSVVWGGSAQCGGNQQTSITTLTPATVSSGSASWTTATFVDSHTITLAANALASCTPTGAQGGCALVWGPDETAFVQSAHDAAANNCGSVEWPAGGIILTANVANTTSKCPVEVGANDPAWSYTGKGQGPRTTLFLFAPGVSFPVGMFSLPSSFSNIRMNLHDFGFASFTSAVAAQSGQFGLNVFFNSNVYDLDFFDFFPSNAQAFTAVQIQGVANAVTQFHDNFMLNSGFTSLLVANTDVNVFGNWIQGATKCVSGNTIQRIKFWGNRVTLCATQGALNITGSGNSIDSLNDVWSATGTTLPVVNLSGTGTINFINPIINGSQTTGPALSIAASNNVTIDGTGSTISSSSGTANGITNAGNLSLRNTTVSSSGGTGLNNSGTVTFLTGNTINNGFTNSGTVRGGFGDCASSNGTCASASNGSVSIAAASTTVTVSTTAVGANSEILIQEDSTLGTKLGVTCNTTTGRTYTITTRTAATSFVITSSAAPATNPACLHFSIREGNSVQ